MVVVHACGLGAAEGTMQAVFFGAAKKYFGDEGRRVVHRQLSYRVASTVRFFQDTPKKVISHSISQELILSPPKWPLTRSYIHVVLNSTPEEQTPIVLELCLASRTCFRPPNSLLRSSGPLSKEYEMLLTELANIIQQSCGMDTTCRYHVAGLRMKSLLHRHI